MIVAIAFFIIGLFIGSFLNVLIDRIPRGENVFIGRSHCEYCHRMLSWKDLFPVISFVFLRGKCRYCHKFIGMRYPIIELTTGLSFALLPFVTPFPVLIFMVGIISCLIVILYTDIFSGIIPDSILLALFLCSFLYKIFSHQPILSSLETGSIVLLFFVFLVLITKGRGMGLGDVKFAGVMGFLLGFPKIIPGLYVAFLTGAGIALILIMARKKSFVSTIAFGPFLVLGTFLGFFWGQFLWKFILHILNL